MNMEKIRLLATKRLILSVLFLVLTGEVLTSAGLAGGAPDRSAPSYPAEGVLPPPSQMNITFRDGLLFLEVRDAEIGPVLREIAEKTGISLTIHGTIGGRVSLKLEGVSLEEALRALGASRAILYEYDPVKKAVRIIGAGVFAATDSKAASSGQSEAAGISSPVASGAPAPGAVLPAGRLRPLADDKELLYDSQRRFLYKPREILVRFRPEATVAQIDALHQSLGSIVLKRHKELKLDCVRVRDGITEEEALALYRAAEIVAAVERHALRYPLLAPNDPLYASQWGLSKIAIESAWNITRGKPDIVVAVIDTGVDPRHPDLAGNLAPGWDFAGKSRSAPNDGDSDPTDGNGHGTHVAGIIAAVGNNGIGIAGVGWNIRIMPLKVQADHASFMELFDIIAAIDYAIAQGVRIINCSFGGEAPSPELEHEAFVRLRQAGILAVCAAGNTGIDNDTASSRIYPASYALDNIISVAASNSSDQLLLSSNYGKSSVHLMAPGDAIRSTGLCPATGTCDSYHDKSGTSMAAPHVSGVAGLILSRNPALRYSRIRSIILDRVDPIFTVENKLVSGGRLNAATALGQVCLPGDVIPDGRIGLADAILALRIASGLEPAASACGTADANGDDLIGLAEAIHALQILSGHSRP